MIGCITYECSTHPFVVVVFKIDLFQREHAHKRAPEWEGQRKRKRELQVDPMPTAETDMGLDSTTLRL